MEGGKVTEVSNQFNYNLFISKKIEMEYIFKDLIEFLEQGYRRKHKEIKDWATIGGNLV